MTSALKPYKDVETRTVSVAGIDFAYRVTGTKAEFPLVLFNHLAGTLDDWDPLVIDGLAAHHMVITFDNRGIGASGGKVPQTVDAMADDAIAFIRALGFETVDVLGFSLGGAVAQKLTFKEPQLVRKLILAGIGPAGAVGINDIPAMAYRHQIMSMIMRRDVRTGLFFTGTTNGRRAAADFFERLKARKNDRDKPISFAAFRSQLKAISDFAAQPWPDLSQIKQPVLVANGESDIMVPSINSAHLALEIPDAKLVLYKDAGHGGIFQYNEEFVAEALEFLKQ